jgi:hypothetical protein
MENKTKLDINNKHHQHLVGILSLFVDEYGYSVRELYQLMDNCQNQLWVALKEIEEEKKSPTTK